jgi:hypothetical protein
MAAKKHSSADIVLFISQILFLVTSLAGALYAADQMAVFEIKLQKDGFVKGTAFGSPGFFYIANTTFALAMVIVLALGIVFLARHKGAKPFLFLWALGAGGYLPVLARDLSYTFASGTYVLFILLAVALSAAVLLFALASTRLFKTKTDSTLATVAAICLAALSIYFFVKTIDQDSINSSTGLAGSLLWPFSLAFSISVFAGSVLTSVSLWLLHREKERKTLPPALSPLSHEPNKAEAKKPEEKKPEPQKGEDKKPEGRKSEDGKPQEEKPEDSSDGSGDAAI